MLVIIVPVDFLYSIRCPVWVKSVVSKKQRENIESVYSLHNRNRESQSSLDVYTDTEGTGGS